MSEYLQALLGYLRKCSSESTFLIAISWKVHQEILLTALFFLNIITSTSLRPCLAFLQLLWKHIHSESTCDNTFHSSTKHEGTPKWFNPYLTRNLTLPSSWCLVPIGWEVLFYFIFLRFSSCFCISSLKGLSFINQFSVSNEISS